MRISLILSSLVAFSWLISMLGPSLLLPITHSTAVMAPVGGRRWRIPSFSRIHVCGGLWDKRSLFFLSFFPFCFQEGILLATASCKSLLFRISLTTGNFMFSELFLSYCLFLFPVNYINYVNMKTHTHIVSLLFCTLKFLANRNGERKQHREQGAVVCISEGHHRWFLRGSVIR